MEFVPLYYEDKIKIINPKGYVGVVTLWSKVDYIYKKLKEQKINLDSQSSPIAAIGNLYGNGLKQLLRNLLYNPQITHICICGKDRSGSKQELVNFFEYGVEEHDVLGVKGKKVIGTKRVLDNLIDRTLFKYIPKIDYIGDLTTQESINEIKSYFKNISSIQKESLERIRLELPETKITHFPSNPRSHTIVKDTPVDAWKELIFRLTRLGHLVHLKKGDRQELQNMKVVVENPKEESQEELEKCGFDLYRFKEYQNHILSPAPPKDDTSYTYGNRIRAYFNNIDSLDEIIKRLRKDKQDRQCFIGLWDGYNDLISDKSNPCLVSLFFRIFEDKLTMTASFRTHNALDAWLENFYGLMAIQNYVSQEIGIESGAITVFSHSISINIEEYERAKAIANDKNFEIEFDPNGNFQIDIENEEIVIKHVCEGIVIDEYRGTKAEKLQLQIAKNCAVSDISHAMYMGREIARAENCLNEGKEYVQK